jgi:hypothetical protein
VAHALPDDDRRPLAGDQHLGGFRNALRVGRKTAQAAWRLRN